VIIALTAQSYNDLKRIRMLKICPFSRVAALLPVLFNRNRSLARHIEPRRTGATFRYYQIASGGLAFQASA
jgi:hypothetical protein